MKSDKVIFSTSEQYSPFWNIQSKIYKESLGIEPICLLFGKKENTNMTEEYGSIIEMEFIKDLPKVIQITWSKFDFPKTEPDTTWMIGDIDMIPLQSYYFTDYIKDAPEDSYLHLNFAGISLPRRQKLDAFLTEGPQNMQENSGDGGEGADLPAHYHISKGKNFIKTFELDRTFREQIEHIIYSGRYGMGANEQSKKPDWFNSEDWEKGMKQIMNFRSYYWCAEESYSSQQIYDAIQSNDIEFYGFAYNNSTNRVDRGTWNDDVMDYQYSVEDLIDGKRYVDIHCERPYKKQEEAMNRIIELSGILKPIGALSE